MTPEEYESKIAREVAALKAAIAARDDAEKVDGGPRVRVPPKPRRRTVAESVAARECSDAIRLGDDVHRVVDECSRALLRSDSVYCRSGALVRVTREAEPPPGVTREPGSPTIRTIGAATLVETLTSVSRFEAYDGRKKDWRPTIPTPTIISALLSRASWPQMRTLKGIIEAPSLRPDGTVIQEAGYDAATGFLYTPDMAFPVVPDRPTHTDAVAARDEILAVVADFPFASEAHKAAWLAFLLTLFARPAIDGCTPLFAIDATTAGTGKGRLVDAAVAIATGRTAPKTPLPVNNEACEKMLTSLFLEGARLACIDNVRAAIELPALEAAITSNVWSNRLLGGNVNLTVPNTLILALTANNLQIGGDLARRTLHIRLESKVEDPQNRTDFVHPELIDWVKTQRGRLVRAALTILRAHAVAGSERAGVKLWGSFEAWSKRVAAAVAWIGMPDPQSTQDGFVTMADRSKGASSVLINEWTRLCKELPSGLSAKEVVGLLYARCGDNTRIGSTNPDGYDDMREALEELVPTKSGQIPCHRLLGYKLRSLRKRVINGRKFVVLDEEARTMRWVTVES